MIVPLRILIGFQSATDHIVTVTDGIAKVTDHFVMETLQEKRVGGGPSVYSKSESAHGGGVVCVPKLFWLRINKVNCTRG